MEITCAYSALRTVLIYGTELSFVVFFEILIALLRPDIVDEQSRVRIVSTEELRDEYDFVIIGGGSAGSVLANRLTENANWTVLLLEAGGDEPIISEVTGLGDILQQTDVDWQYKTEPSSTYCLGMNNNQCSWPAGKALGGGSMHNGMLHVRGNRRDYDQWRDLGNPGWGYEDVLPYFKKSEDMRIAELRNSPYHGTGGYLTVERYRNASENYIYFLDAGFDLGYDVLDDVNGESQVGFARPQSTLRDGLRCSMAKAFLRSASHRENLYVSTYSVVDKILIDEATKTAHGVQFRRDGEKHTVYARSEVILSAGTIQSPRLLMMSGIGPQEHLRDVGIPIIHHSPGVGQNLQEHVAMGALTYLIDMPSESSVPITISPRGSSVVTMSAIEEFLYEKNGPLYDISGEAVLAFIKTKYAEDPSDYPDIQFVISLFGDNFGGGFFTKRNLGLRDNLYESLFGNIQNNGSYALWPALLHPKSRGYIKLRDADPDHHPIIVPNYLENKHDMDVLIDGVRIAYEMSQTTTLKMFNARPNPNPIPECAHFIFYSDDYLKCQARYYTLTSYHPTSTCKMGPADDTMAVVDSRLRVYGVNCLRVVDASVMPNIVSGNTNAPTIMIAEKTADMIKEDHNHYHA